MPPLQQIGFRAVDGLLAIGGEEGAKRHVIRPYFPCFHRQMPRGMAGDAENLAFQQPPPFRMITIPLAEMRAITAEAQRQRGVIIQQQGDIPRGGHRHEDFGRPGDLVLGRVFQAELEASDIPAIQSRRQMIAKGQRIELLRGNQIEPAGFGHRKSRLNFGAKHAVRRFSDKVVHFKCPGGLGGGR